MAEVIVLGAGIIGSAIAFELARRGARVILLERAVPGAESSSAAAGMLAPQLEGEHADATFDLGLWSRGLWSSYAEELGGPGGGGVGYRQDGAFILCAGPEELEQLWQRHQWQRARGLKVERTEGAALRGRLPGLSDRYDGALFLPDEAQIDPRLLMPRLQAAAREAGVRCISGETALRVVVEAGRVQGVELADRRLAASRVVVAAGAWSSRVLGAGVPEQVVEPARGQMLALALPAPLFAPFVWCGRGYMVPRADGRILVGSTMERVGFNKAVTAGGLKHLLDTVVGAFPSLAGAPVVETWSGLRPWTADTAPILGRGPAEGLFVATGHSRNGILQAPATARVISELVLGKPPSVDLAPFSLARFA